MRTDFLGLEDGARIVLHPRAGNPLHDAPVPATHDGGYLYCDGSDPDLGPDYFVGTIHRFCEGFELEGAA